MSQKYFPIYTAIKAGHAPDEYLWQDFIAHCRCEINRRITYYHFSLLDNQAAVDRILHDFTGNLVKAVKKNFDPDRVLFKTYVNGILDKMVINAAKDLNRRKREQCIDEYCEKLDEANDPEKIAMIKEDIRVLQELLDHLTAIQYEVIKLRLIDGLSNEEVALKLGITPEKVSRRLNKAVERIRTLYKKNNKTLNLYK